MIYPLQGLIINMIDVYHARNNLNNKVMHPASGARILETNYIREIIKTLNFGEIYLPIAVPILNRGWKY